ncbi:BspA family leucine-rich repeat surface protein [Clostridium sp.]
MAVISKPHRPVFSNNYGIRTLNGLQNWNTAKVVSMNYIFADCRNLKDVSAVSSWKRTSLKYSENAFQNCKASSPW